MTEALLQGVPDHRTEDEALAAFGLVREVPIEPPTVDVWPENWKALQVYIDCSTQWRMSPAGRSGLDHSAVRQRIAANTVQRRRERVLDQVRAMEVHALKWWSDRRERKA